MYFNISQRQQEVMYRMDDAELTTCPGKYIRHEVRLVQEYEDG